MEKERGREGAGEREAGLVGLEGEGRGEGRRDGPCGTDMGDGSGAAACKECAARGRAGRRR